jgi:hypothetical protein
MASMESTDPMRFLEEHARRGALELAMREASVLFDEVTVENGHFVVRTTKNESVSSSIIKGTVTELLAMNRDLERP